MAWTILLIAGIFEIGWAVGLKYTDGFSRLLPTVLTVAAMVVSMMLLAYAVKTIPVGTGYAVWTGIGVIGTALLGVVLFAEPVNAPRVVFLLIILAGILGLRLNA